MWLCRIQTGHGWATTATNSCDVGISFPLTRSSHGKIHGTDACSMLFHLMMPCRAHQCTDTTIFIALVRWFHTNIKYMKMDYLISLICMRYLGFLRHPACHTWPTKVIFFLSMCTDSKNNKRTLGLMRHMRCNSSTQLPSTAMILMQQPLVGWHF